MKRNEIEIGGFYSNGKGRIRKVIAMEAQYKFYDVGSAAWAKERVE